MKIYISPRTRKQLKKLADINRRSYSVEIEIAIEEHIQRFEEKFGKIPDDPTYGEFPIDTPRGGV